MNREKFNNIPNLHKGVIDEIIDELKKLGVDVINTVTEINSTLGRTLLVTTNSQVYYIGLNIYGFLEIIREDSTTGKIVYVPIDD